MTTPRFLQIHTLHSYPAALLNRDDTGLAKRMPFGSAVRTRISSQCLKRHWRVADDDFAIHNISGAADAVRSRNIVGREVIQPLRDRQVAGQEVLDSVEEAFRVGVYGSSGATESSRQPLLLGLPEVEYLREKARIICRDHAEDAKEAAAEAKKFFDDNKQNFKAMREHLIVDLPKGMHGGLVGTLFGRMVTSDPGANIDAAVHVAHAFTVHAEESESDYFSVVDDLQSEDEDPGAAHIGDMELTAGLFYGYVVVDVPGLISNLEGCDAKEWESADRGLAAQVVEHLVHLIATVSPGAKLGSTAPYAYADLMLVEAGIRQPRSLANAFRNPAKPQVGDAMGRLSAHIAKLDDCYGPGETRRLMSVEDCDLPATQRLNLNNLASWAADVVRNGKAA